MFVLVDELDRCRPTYAIELLERVKHLFNVTNVVFIFATDTAQLKHAVGAVYGEQFDGGRYLLRFFDRTYSFSEPNLEPFVSELFRRNELDVKKLSSPNKNDHAGLFVTMMMGYGIEPRDAEQCFDLLKDVVTLWQEGVPLELVYLLPVVMATQRRDTDLLRTLQAMEHGEPLNALSRGPRARRVEFKRFVDDGFRQHPTEPERITVVQLVKTFMETFKQDLTSGGEWNRTDGHVEWVRERFRIEFQERLGGGYQSGRRYPSLVRGYAELVRAAGKLSSK